MHGATGPKVILVACAHPDDSELGMGATIARLTAEGNEVYIACMADGVTSRYADPSEAPLGEIEDRQEAARQAAKILGVKDVYFYDYPDNRMDSAYLLDVVKDIEQLIANLKPSVIYTHHHGDLNIDHQLVHRAVLTATRPVTDCPVREVYTFETPSSTEWGMEPFRPNVFVEMSTYLPAKLDAVNCYSAEMRQYPHPRSVTAIRARAQYWGSVAGLYAAEAFCLVRSVRI